MFRPAWTLLLQETVQQTAWQRMDPTQRGRVFLMLAMLVMLGFVMIGLAWFGARATRYYANRKIGPAEPSGGTPRDADAWAKKPLVTAYDESDSQDDSSNHE